MTSFDNFRENRREWKTACRKQNSLGSRWAGVFLLLIGGTILLKTLLFPIPDWVFTWPMILIALGLFIGLRHGFRGGTWFFLILIGGAFLVNQIYPELALRQYIWPTLLMILGLVFIIRPRSKKWDEKKQQGSEGQVGLVNESVHIQDDYIDSTCIFGGTKKNILSKNFKGGDIVNIFGGSEINLSQADFNGRVELEVTQIFGGTKLYVPSNWEVKPEIVAIFGGIEDKRDMMTSTTDKVLVLKGTSIFGGIDIKRY